MLGKKSWNVYNQDNIDKVKRDEAVAKAKEEAEEQRMQEIDAERRIQVLRGEIPPPLPVVDAPTENDVAPQNLARGPGRERKRRKYAGEDDTSYELRIAREQAEASVAVADTQLTLRKPAINTPLTDYKGHIDLFPQDRGGGHAPKNAEAEKETARKKKEYEDQFTMRFSNAAGFKQGLESPWYSTSGTSVQEILIEAPSKDVWGNEDPRRKERQAERIVSNDPLAAMKQGAAKVREVDRERKRWQERRQKEIDDMARAEEKGRRRKRTHEEEDTDSLEGFSLDAPRTKRRERDMGQPSRPIKRHSHDHSRRSSHRPSDIHGSELVRSRSRSHHSKDPEASKSERRSRHDDYGSSSPKGDNGRQRRSDSEHRHRHRHRHQGELNDTRDR